MLNPDQPKGAVQASFTTAYISTSYVAGKLSTKKNASENVCWSRLLEIIA